MQGPTLRGGNIEPRGGQFHYFGFGSSLMGSRPVGAGPSTLAINPATHTIYVAKRNTTDNGTQFAGARRHGCPVINARDCQAQDLSRCKGPGPTITVGRMPSGVAIDTRTNTVYVSNVQDNTVSVVHGRHMQRGEHLRLRADAPQRCPLDWTRSALFADPGNHTVDVPQLRQRWRLATTGSTARTVSMIDSATCNANRSPTGLPDHRSAGG